MKKLCPQCRVVCRTSKLSYASRPESLASVGYREGLTDYLSVLDSQAALLLARRSLLLAEGRLLSSLVRLEKALGGGWSMDEAEPRAAAD